MDIGKDLSELLAVLRREAEDPVILVVVMLALMVGIAWLDRYVNRHDPSWLPNGCSWMRRGRPH